MKGRCDLGFQELNIAIRYRSEMDDFSRDFLIPVLEKCVCYKRAVGYFSTSALIDISKGLFAMAKKGGKIELVCSPNLDKEDIEAIDFGYKTREEVIEEALLREIKEPVDYFEKERLNLVATLIANGYMDIKIAFLEETDGNNLYHEKIAVFIDEEGNKIGYTGSMNESDNGFSNNFESIFTFSSWKDQSQKQGVEVIENDFEHLWQNETKKLQVIPFPKLVVERLMKYKKDRVDDTIDEQQFGYHKYLKQQMKFKIPDTVEMREYQKKAIDNWIRQDYQGIFNMSTGSGKTFTALYGMVRLAEVEHEKLAVFIICPYIHLVSQWEEDVVNWAPIPIIAHSKSPNKKWEDDLFQAYRRFKKYGKPFICITTLDTFADKKIQKFVIQFTKEENVLLIVDEAHNFGSGRMTEIMPYNIRYRMALSATIKRYMDKIGTEKLYDYFGEECIDYGLREAIGDGNLVHYEYHPVLVYLTEDELKMYGQLTRKLRKYIVFKDKKVKISEAGKHIIFERTRLLAGARNKVGTLMQLMKPYKKDNNILVYCGATSVEDEESGEEKRQIDLITAKLQTEYEMSVKRFTAEEDLKERQRIKKYFAQGMYQAITAIKCLDEGVNIPGIKTAFILSSSRNPKEFIQRRGRLLRKSPGKKKAVIYDFVTLPRDLDDVMYGDYEEDKTILLGEMARIEEFGRLSDNPEVADACMNRIMESYDTYVDVAEEVKKMEEYYGV